MGEKRRYESSHPWITFQVDLRRAGTAYWMNLGAIQSKCEHVANVLLPPAVASELLILYLAKGVQATTAIEGNTLSEAEVRERIEKRRPLPKSREYLGLEVDNVERACNRIAEEMIEGGLGWTMTPERICTFNETVLDGLPGAEEMRPGKVRPWEVGVADYRGAPAEDCDYLLGRTCEWINGLRLPTDPHGVASAVVRATLAHLYLAWIHPFADGNGRTARLVEVQILLGAGVPMVAAHLLSNHYNQTRDEYYRQLSRASKSGDPVPFLEYAAQGFVDGLDGQIALIRKHQHALVWRDFVYDSFRGRKTGTAYRQRQLALELGKRGGKKVLVKHVGRLSPELAGLYARKTSKTVARDVNELARMRLAVRGWGSVRANLEVLRAFRPRRRDRPKRAVERRSASR